MKYNWVFYGGIHGRGRIGYAFIKIISRDSDGIEYTWGERAICFAL